ncbi:MAG: hypothetical protein ABTQ34_04810 [Bdellovibrionales bacterium]
MMKQERALQDAAGSRDLICEDMNAPTRKNKMQKTKNDGDDPAYHVVITPEWSAYSSAVLDNAIERFKAELCAKGSAVLPTDRKALENMCERLLQRRERQADELGLSAQSIEDFLADAIVSMMDDEIRKDETK